MITDDDSSGTTDVLSPGQLLAQAREQAQLTLQEVAEALHMSVSKVRAIEADDYAKLNVNTFVRGYLRSYAILVKINPAELIAAYEQQVGTSELLPSVNYYAGKASSGRKAWVFIGSLVLLLAILLLISIWFFGNRITPPPTLSSAPLEPAQTLLNAPVQANPLATATNASEENAIDSVASDAEAVSADTEQDVSVSVNPKPELDVLQLNFSEECWLEVSDARGDVLATELQRPGSSLSLQGVAPFQVKLGNAPAAQISLNGESVEISPPSDDKVFSMSVGQ